LILFDEVLAWKTARASSAAQDRELTRRANPGADLLPSNGGVFGATYLNPTLVIRPRRELDLKLGAVIAQTTADLVDPVELRQQRPVITMAESRPADPGRARRGCEYRLPLDYSMIMQLGLMACSFRQRAADGGDRMAAVHRGGPARTASQRVRVGGVVRRTARSVARGVYQSKTGPVRRACEWYRSRGKAPPPAY
jgi:hypothetical protein